MTLTDTLRGRLYQSFIDDHPATIVLQRSPITKSTAGGKLKGAPVNQAAQVGRLIYSGNKGDNVQRTLPDGNVLVITHTLVFMPGANVERFDEFDLDGNHYVITAVARVPDWRVSCEVGRQHA